MLGSLTLAVAASLVALLARHLVGGIHIDGHNAVISVADSLVIVPVSVALIFQGPRYLKAAEVSLLLLLETVFGPGLVWVVLGERPAAAVMASALVIVCVLAIHTWLGVLAERDRLPRQ